MNITIQSFGCSSNIHEGEVMAGLLKQAGYAIVKQPTEADVIILNLCTVKGHHTALQAIKKVLSIRAKLIAAGCIHEHTKKAVREFVPNISFINTHNIQDIVSVVKQVQNGEIVDATTKEKKVKIQLPKVRINSIINIIPIEEGCTSACAYCSVKLIKGHVFSYPLQDICQEVQTSINEGVKEIYLTGQDTGAYGLDKKDNLELPELLEALCQIKGNFMIRVGMTSPNHVHRHLTKLIIAFQHPKIYKFLHIPIQSGSNTVLKSMKRPYSVEEYKECITEFKKAIPKMTIATDIIVGFPGETEEDFQQTLELIEETTPVVVNISRFVPRPNTVAATM
ncbi:MAG: tRNA (N(6)-L-threonylcarbamoyladenosine(37)-C(2))-methylthiotransferase, partial [Candidatus Woesearchaeota archaeon]